MKKWWHWDYQDLELFCECCWEELDNRGGEEPNWNRVMQSFMGQYTYNNQSYDALDEIQDMMQHYWRHAHELAIRFEQGAIDCLYWGEGH